MGGLRILVVDDHDVVRQGLRALLENHSGWEVCGEAATGPEALDKSQTLKPDVVVLDVAIPELNGLEVGRRIRKARPETQLLMLTMYESEDLVSEVLKLGARGFILKSDAGRDLVAAVEALSQHRPYFTSRVARLLLKGYLTRTEPAGSGRVAPHRLSAREREVVQMLAEGKSNREIAGDLEISVKTVEAHRSNIMHKLDLHSISQLTRYAIRNRMIQP